MMTRTEALCLALAGRYGCLHAMRRERPTRSGSGREAAPPASGWWQCFACDRRPVSLRIVPSARGSSAILPSPMPDPCDLYPPSS